MLSEVEAPQRLDIMSDIIYPSISLRVTKNENKNTLADFADQADKMNPFNLRNQWQKKICTICQICESKILHAD